MNKQYLEKDFLKSIEEANSKLLEDEKEKELEIFFNSINCDEEACVMLYIINILDDKNENRKIALKVYNKKIEKYNLNINKNKGITL